MIEIIRADGVTSINGGQFAYTSIDGMYGDTDGEGFQGSGNDMKDMELNILCTQVHGLLKQIDKTCKK